MIFVLNQSDELYEPTLNTDSSERPYQKKPLFFAPLYFAKFAFSEMHLAKYYVSQKYGPLPHTFFLFLTSYRGFAFLNFSSDFLTQRRWYYNFCIPAPLSIFVIT